MNDDNFTNGMKEIANNPSRQDDNYQTTDISDSAAWIIVALISLIAVLIGFGE